MSVKNYIMPRVTQRHHHLQLLVYLLKVTSYSVVTFDISIKYMLTRKCHASTKVRNVTCTKETKYTPCPEKRYHFIFGCNFAKC